MLLLSAMAGQDCVGLVWSIVTRCRDEIGVVYGWFEAVVLRKEGISLLCEGSDYFYRHRGGL
jgi:hypothetical protein